MASWVLLIRGATLLVLAEAIIDAVGVVFGRHVFAFLFLLWVEAIKLDPSASTILKAAVEEIPEIERLV